MLPARSASHPLCDLGRCFPSGPQLAHLCHEREGPVASKEPSPSEPVIAVGSLHEHVSPGLSICGQGWPSSVSCTSSSPSWGLSPEGPG